MLNTIINPHQYQVGLNNNCQIATLLLLTVLWEMGITQVRAISYGMKLYSQYWMQSWDDLLRTIPFEGSRSKNQFDISLSVPADYIFQVLSLPRRCEQEDRLVRY